MAMLSAIGFGSYRIDQQHLEHQKALRHALSQGCNLIDTSTNYADGESESLIGSVLALQPMTEERPFVVSKVGYIQGVNLDLAFERSKAGKPYQDVVEYNDDCWHCIHPDFISDQLTLSLERLKRPSLDALLLHNPEYFLKKSPNPTEYYRRIQLAFEHLEKEVSLGRIKSYGISSNSFPDPIESPEFTSLVHVIELAKSISEHHHFKFIQFPFNLFEPGALFEDHFQNQSLLDCAQDAGLTTLINRPLNAFSKNRLIRIADFKEQPAALLQLEKSFQQTIALEALCPGDFKNQLKQLPNAHWIQRHFMKIQDLFHWRDLLDYKILPSFDFFTKSISQNQEHIEWASEYERVMDGLLKTITLSFEDKESEKSRHLSKKLVEACPELQSSQTLSQKAIRIYLSIPGVHHVLVGMRKSEYVDDVLRDYAPLPQNQAVACFETAYQWANSW